MKHNFYSLQSAIGRYYKLFFTNLMRLCLFDCDEMDKNLPYISYIPGRQLTVEQLELVHVNLSILAEVTYSYIQL
jgi:hypothetical protein